MAATVTNKPQTLTTGSLADVYQYTGTKWAIVKAIQVANTNASATQTVQVTLQQSGTDYSLVQNLTIPVGSAASILTDILGMKPNDKIRGYISSGNASSVSIIVTVEEYS